MLEFLANYSALLITLILAVVHLVICSMYFTDMNARKDIFVIPTFALAMTVFAISTLMLELRQPKSKSKLPLLAVIGVSISLISMGFIYMMRDAWDDTWKRTYASFVLALPLIVGFAAVIIPECMEGKCSRKKQNTRKQG